MKRGAVLSIALCFLVMVAASVISIVGCHSSSDSIGPGGQGIRQDCEYAGNRYICTSVMVASQETGAETPSNVMYVGSIFEAGEYDVYLIEGVDENEAIALKIGMWGGCLYYKYERLYGQEEPADFVYEGRDYADTSEIVTTQRVSHPASGTPEAVSYLSSVIYHGTTYDVYSIQGVAENQAIALRIAKAGTTVGFYYYYYKYERR
jgi:hypothetical protein